MITDSLSNFFREKTAIRKAMSSFFLSVSSHFDSLQNFVISIAMSYQSTVPYFCTSKLTAHHRELFMVYIHIKFV